jgi:hypothetical protein
MANDLTEKQLTFVVWAAQPDGIREPDTDSEWADVFGVNRSTVWRWRKDPRVAQAIRFIVIQQAGNPLNVGRVLDMVLARALSGDEQYALKAAELWMKAVGVTGQNNQKNSILESLEEEDSFADFSTEELERLKAEAEAGKAEQAKIDVARIKLAGVGVE